MLLNIKSKCEHIFNKINENRNRNRNRNRNTNTNTNNNNYYNTNTNNSNDYSNNNNNNNNCKVVKKKISLVATSVPRSPQLFINVSHMSVPRK